MHQRTGARKLSTNLGDGAFSLSAQTKYFILRREINNSLKTQQCKVVCWHTDNFCPSSGSRRLQEISESESHDRERFARKYFHPNNNVYKCKEI